VRIVGRNKTGDHIAFIIFAVRIVQAEEIDHFFITPGPGGINAQVGTHITNAIRIDTTRCLESEIVETDVEVPMVVELRKPVEVTDKLFCAQRGIAHIVHPLATRCHDIHFIRTFFTLPGVDARGEQIIKTIR